METRYETIPSPTRDDSGVSMSETQRGDVSETQCGDVAETKRGDVTETQRGDENKEQCDSTEEHSVTIW